MAYSFPHGIHDDVRCPHCGAEPLRSVHGSCRACKREIVLATAEEVPD